ncbi:MAG TPA: hypothetical protein PKM73_05820 [Verrucomicrobiota bacterium]|nr:hypothetical protein [Verrucomicrobiota bacterium]HNU50494.1 hypothetical protein [Verrucomicrobiota bacterium]
MKSVPTRLSPCATLLACASLLLPAVNGLGQGGSGSGPAAPPAIEGAGVEPLYLPLPPKPEPIQFDAAVEHKRVEARFENLPLSEVVAWLEKTFPEVNVVLPQRLVEADPAVFLRLRSAGLRDILEAISIATDGAVVSEVRSPTLVALRPRTEPVPVGPGVGIQGASSGVSSVPPPSDPEALQKLAQRYGIGMGGGMGGGGGMVGVSGRAGTRAQEAPVRPIEPAASGQPVAGWPGGYGGMGLMMGGASQPAPLAYQVMNLRDILRVNDPKKTRELLEVVEKITEKTLQTMAGDSGELQQRLRIRSFDYHEGSGVLVILGQPDAIKLAMEVIRNLRVRESGDAAGGVGKEEGKEP